MPDIVHVSYGQTGESAKINKMGMREMQQKAYQARDAQYLLLKAPPASGKSRALMFVALDKLVNQGIRKVIVAVPERSIGGSFGITKLTEYGFYADWNYNEQYNLCTPCLLYTSICDYCSIDKWCESRSYKQNARSQKHKDHTDLW